MKFIAPALVLVLLTFSVHAASIQGDITLPFSLSEANGTASTSRFGDKVKATWSCRVSEFCGWETVFARLTVTNTCPKPMWGQCCVAFYDKDKNLVGTISQTFLPRRGLKPRSSHTWAVKT